MARASNAAPLEAVRTRADVANLLGTSTQQLGLLLHGRPESQRYTTFTINKRRGGTRTILAPRPDLKSLQARLAEKLDEVYRPRQVVHGFVCERGIVSNADQHLATRHLLNVDLKDFFPSINFGRVRGLFMSSLVGAGAEAATVMAQICCHKNMLPQGSPASPVVSNMICSRMDRQLLELARRYQCKYTRYVDDLSLSKKRGSFPPELGHLDENGRVILCSEFRVVIEANGFQPNPEKVWLFGNAHRQTVTGLIVNKKSNVRRQFVRQVRAMIHAWDIYGFEKAQAEYEQKYWHPKRGQQRPPSLAAVIRGKLEFIKMVKGMQDPVYRHLQQQFVQVDPSYYLVMEQENSLMKQRDLFISHASEDKVAMARPLAEQLVVAGISVWYDEYSIRLGDDILESIDQGLVNSRFGLLIISPSFFAAKKTWTKREYSALVAGEDVTKQKRILPVWHQMTQAQVYEKSPTIANRAALVAANMTLEEMVAKIVQRIRDGEAA